MKKLLLTTTLLVATSVTTQAGAFGGLGILGHKSSHKGGVNAIGVHIDTENKEQPNIDIRSCDSETEELVGSECCKKTLIYTDNDTTKCCSTEGYAVQDGKCKKQCDEGLVLNEETDDCEDTCPAERRCGETCCGEHNICVDDNKCCYGDKYEDEDGYWYDENRCCAASASSGFSTMDGSCCAEGTYPSYNPHEDETHCCPVSSAGWSSWTDECCAQNAVLFYVTEGDHTICCPAGSTGYENGECI